MKAIIFLMVLLSGVFCRAEVIEVIVTKGETTNNEVYVVGSDLSALTVDDYVRISDACTLKVKIVSAKNGILDSEYCESKSDLVNGKKLELTVFSNHQRESDKVQPTQSRSSIKIDKPMTVKKENRFRFEGIVKSSKTGFWKGESSWESEREDYSYIKEDFGLSLGYEKISTNNIGFMSRFVFTQIYSELQTARIEAAATYGLSDSIYIFGGLNMNKYVKSKHYDKAPWGLGFQLGAGYDVNERLGFSLSYVDVKNSYKESGSKYEFGQAGLELGISTYF